MGWLLLAWPHHRHRIDAAHAHTAFSTKDRKLTNTKKNRFCAAFSTSQDLAGGQEQRGRGATAAFLWSGDDHHEAQGDSIWTGILADDETIIKEGKVKKYKGMFYKKRILLLTDKARLVYLDPSNMQPKGEIPLDRELEVAVKSDHAFTVKHGKDSYVMDTQGQRDAVEWVESIKEMQDFINS